MMSNFMIELFLSSLYFWSWYYITSFEYFRSPRILFKNYTCWNKTRQKVVKKLSLSPSQESEGLRGIFTKTKNSKSQVAFSLTCSRPWPKRIHFEIDQLGTITSISINTKYNQIIICLVTDKYGTRAWSCAINFFDPILIIGRFILAFQLMFFLHWIISKEIDQLVGFSVWKGFPLTSLLK